MERGQKVRLHTRGHKNDDAEQAGETTENVSVILGHNILSCASIHYRVYVYLPPDQLTVASLCRDRPLQTPLYKAGDAEICFIVKDPQRTMKDYFAEHGNCGVTKVRLPPPEEQAELSPSLLAKRALTAVVAGDKNTGPGREKVESSIQEL